MRATKVTCTLVITTMLCGCQTVKYPGAVDETPPAGVELTLETTPGNGQNTPSGRQNAAGGMHRLSAAMKRAGGGVATMSIDMITADDVIIVRASAMDEESGIKELRVTGAKRVCEEDPKGGPPRATDYVIPQVWLVKDFAPTGRERIPKKVTEETKISAAVLTGATRRNGASLAGQNASFQFYVEATNGAGKQSASQWLEYRIGKMGCP